MNTLTRTACLSALLLLTAHEPAAQTPLTRDELQSLGVFWLDDAANKKRAAGAQPVFVTRLHARYTSKTFPEDLRFQTTGDRTNYQVRYVLQHPFTGAVSCPESTAQKTLQ